ncbi:MAG: diheme cytochrome c-553 [bacterium]
MKRCTLSGRRSPLRALALLVGLSAALAACQSAGTGGASTSTKATTPAVAAADPVEHGRYLVTVGACNDCHTPWKMGAQGPEPDMTRMLSGQPAKEVPPPAKLPDGWMMLVSATNTEFVGPWGTSYAANLTPDETGLASVTEEMFVKALREGKHFGSGRPILPPMPWNWYAKMTDDDLRAIWAYLRTIPPVENVVPEAVPPAGAPGAPPAK